MSTDEMIQQHIDNPKIPEFGSSIPFEQPAQPKPKRESSIFGRLRAKLAKAKRLGAASAEALVLVQAGVKPKVAAKTLMRAHGIKVREARQFYHAAQPRKKRRRS